MVASIMFNILYSVFCINKQSRYAYLCAMHGNVRWLFIIQNVKQNSVLKAASLGGIYNMPGIY